MPIGIEIFECKNAPNVFSNTYSKLFNMSTVF